MLNIERKLKRLLELTNRQKCVFFICALFVLWKFGLLDRFSETSFSEFTWPSGSLSNFKYPEFTRLPACNHSKDSTNLLIIVKSSVKNSDNRAAIRETWGHGENEKIKISTIFLVGKSENPVEERALDSESIAFVDLLSINAIDSYRNNTYKFFAALNYAVSPPNCESSDFVFLVDDDYLVHIPNLINFINSKNKNEQIYEGFVFDTSPFRFTLHKHRISLEEYPFSQYPPYVSAGAVFLSSRTVKEFRDAIPKLKIFPFDDVYTGILAKSTNVRAIHNDKFVFWSRSISKEEWNKKKILAAHGYSPKELRTQFNLIL